MYTQQRRITPLFFTDPIVAVLCLLIGFSLFGSPKASADVVIGKATLVIGTAYIQTEDQKQRLKSGDAIYSDRHIITTANGHVHIRFNDQGLISVRPNSRLSIDEYDYNSVNPSQSTVKFSLIRGSTRSVSGKAAQSAKQRFRMNTPIAAIGVRGTDFVVRTDKMNIQAIVNEGAIIVAPFSDQCSVNTYGPCAKNSVVLDGDSKKFLQFNQLLAAPELLPATQIQLQDQLRSSPEDNQDSKSANTQNKVDKVDKVDKADKADKESALAYNENLAKDSLSNTFVSNTQTPVTPDLTPVTPDFTQVTPDFTPSQALTEQQLTIRALVWGRWGAALPTDKIVLSSTIAKQTHNITVGNHNFVLFRSGSDQVINQNLGNVSFNLDSAQAHYMQGSDISAMRVEGGSLNIDFNSNTFDTALNLQHSATGSLNFNAAGSINQRGIFISRTNTRKLAGVVSFDAKEAGYFFTEELGTGSIEGITLWGTQQP
jgi:hypothetical protein